MPSETGFIIPKFNSVDRSVDSNTTDHVSFWLEEQQLLGIRKSMIIGVKENLRLVIHDADLEAVQRLGKAWKALVPAL